MKRIILHIGTEKTGTTSLQTFFTLNQNRLSDHGIWYPHSESLDYCHRNAHFPLAAALLQKCPDFVTREKHFDANRLYATLLDDFDARKEGVLLLSAEHFSSRCSHPERLSALRMLFRDYPVDIIVYVRPQHEMLLSAYSTYLRSGGQKSLEKVSKEKWLKRDAIYFNHLRLIERWWQAFGQEAVNIRLFQQSKSGNELFRDFLSFCGVPWINNMKQPNRENTTISKELAEFLLIANQHFCAFANQDRHSWEQGQRFRQQFSALFPEGQSLEHLLSDKLKRETQQVFAEDNAILASSANTDLKSALMLPQGEKRAKSSTLISPFCKEEVNEIVNLWKSGEETKARSRLKNTSYLQNTLKK